MKKIITILLSLVSLIFLSFVLYAFLSNIETQNLVFAHKSAQAKGDKIIVLRISPQENLSLELFHIDAKQKSELLGSYGEYSLSAIYPLLKIDKKSDAYINASFSHSLEILVAEVIGLETVPEMKSQNQIRQFLFDICLGKYGQIGLKDRLKLAKLLLRMNELHAKVESLENVKQLDFDENSSDCSVALINTTSKNGLGKKVARIIEKNGFRVVKIDDNSEAQKESAVFLTQKDRCIELAQLLYRVLPTAGKANLNEEYFSKYRSDIVIMLGDDLN